MEEKEMKEKFEQWCREFMKCEIEEMNRDLTKIFLTLTMSEIEKSEIPSTFCETMAYKILDKRADYIDLKLSKHVKVFLTFLTDRPGTIVMYLYYLRFRAKTNEVNMEDLSRIFPMGFPTPKALETTWNKQKIPREDTGSDNLLDIINFN